MIIEKLFLIHAGILGVISFVTLILGSVLGTYWRKQKRFGRRNRKIHGYFSLAAYILTLAHVGQGMTAYVDLQGEFVGLALVLHWIHIFLAIGFLAFFTKVLVDGYRGTMKCRNGYIALLLNAILIITGYVIRNVAFGEIFYPFL